MSDDNAGSESVKKPENPWILISLAVLFAASFLFTLGKVNTYEKRTYDSSHYEESEDILAALTEAHSVCKNKTTAADQNTCYELIGAIVDKRISLHDLGAQETMALATRGLLWIGALQAITGFLAVIFLIWTVVQSSRLLAEATKSTKAAENAERAQIYFSVEFKLVPDNENASRLKRVRPIIKIANYGKTPALKVQAVVIFEELDSRSRVNTSPVSRLLIEVPIAILAPTTDGAGIALDPPEIEAILGQGVNDVASFYIVRTEVSYLTVFDGPDSKGHESRWKYEAKFKTTSDLFFQEIRDTGKSPVVNGLYADPEEYENDYRPKPMRLRRPDPDDAEGVGA